MNPVTESGAQRKRFRVRWLRDVLRAEIQHGSYGRHHLPSEGELMLSHDASRAVVREALDLLRHEGIIERLPGTGTFVVGRRRAARLVEVHGVTDLDPSPFSMHVVARCDMAMPAAVAHHLEEPRGTRCLMIEYVGIANGSVVGLYTNYLRYPEAERISATPLRGHWYEFLHEAGMEIDQTDLLIESITADEILAAHLRIAPGQPVLAMEQVIRDCAGRPYNFAVLRHRGDRLALHSHAATATTTRTDTWDASMAEAGSR